MPAPVRTTWGIAGVGPQSKAFADAVNELNSKHHAITAVAAHKQPAALDLAKKCDLIPLDNQEQDGSKKSNKSDVDVKLYGNWQDLAADVDVAVVYVNVGDNQRTNVVQMMINNGKHVVVENLQTLPVEKVSALIQLAQEKKVLLAAAAWMRFSPATEKALKMIGNNRIGKPQNIVVCCGVVGKKRGDEPDLLHCISNGLDFVMTIYGGERPAKMDARVFRGEVISGDDAEVGTGASLFLSFSEGRTATVAIDGRVDLPCNAVVAGTNASIELGAPLSSSPRLSLFRGGRLLRSEDFSGQEHQLADRKALAEDVRSCITKGEIESAKTSAVRGNMVSEVVADILNLIKKEGN